jgi:outer membrane protein assembly factor BamB/tetratricopeptide (TPR) repeat protein
MSFKGDLSTIGLAEVFQMISMSQKEGTLIVQDGESRKCIYFGPSGVKLTSTGRRKGMRLGDMLVRAGKISEDALNEALESTRISKKKLGEALVENGAITAEEIEQVVRAQIEEEIYDLFLWKKASFEFVEGPPSESLTDPEMHATQLSFDVNGLLLEAVRRADEWNLINQKIPSMDSIFVFLSDRDRAAEDAVAPDALKRVYRLLDGRRSVAEVVEQTGVSRFEVCKGLVDLFDRGRIRLLTVEEMLQAAARCLADGQREKGLRLYMAAAAQAPDDPKVIAGVARVLENEGLSKEAASTYAKAGRLALQKGDVDRALDLLGQSHRLAPEDGEIRYLLFEAHAAAGNLEEGKRLARELVGQALMAATDYVRARGLADRIVAADPADLDFRILRAKVLHRMNLRRELEEDLTYIRKNMPVDPRKAEAVERELAEIQMRRPSTVLPPPAARKRRRWGKPAAVLAVLLAAGAAALGAWIEIRERRRLTEILAGAEPRLERHEYDEARREVEGFLSSARSPWQRARAGEFLQRLEAHRRGWTQERSAQEEERRRRDQERMRELSAWIEEERLRSPELALKRARDLRDLAEANRDRAFLLRAEELASALERYLSDSLQLKVKADELEKEGKVREAALLIDKLITDYPNTPAAREARYPIEIATFPPGVRVTLRPSGMVLGETGEQPLRHRMKSGEVVRFLFERPGYVSVEREVRDKTVGRLKVELTEKSEAWVLPLGITVSGGLAVLGDTLYAGARDRLFALRLRSRPVIEWYQSLEGSIEGMPVAGSDLLYAGTSGHAVYAIRPAPADGRRIAWRYPTGERLSGAPALSPDGKILYVCTADRMLHAVDAATGMPLWKRELPGECRGDLVPTADGAIAACDDGTILRLRGGADGGDVWRVRAETDFEATGAGEGVVYAATSAQTLWAVDAAEGRLLWKREVPSRVSAPLVRVGDLVFAGGRNGRMYFLDAARGTLVGNFETGGPILGGAAAHGTVVLFGSEDQSFYAFDALSRSLLWRYRGRGKIRGTPRVHGKHVYFSVEEILYAIELN